METVLGRQIRVATWRADPGERTRPPLLFFTGIGAALELMAPFLDRLTASDVITFDVPGIGGSPPPQAPYRPGTIADIAEAILAGRGYGEVDVMGVSWGGMMAQQFAFRHSARVRKLVLAATSPGTTMVPGKWSALVRMVSPRRYADRDYVHDHFAQIYGGRSRGTADYDASVQQPTQAGYWCQLLAIAGWSSLPMLPFIQAKTLVLSGAQDRLVRPINARILHRLLPNARLETLEHAGHMFLLTHKRKVAGLLDEFLGDEPRAASSDASWAAPLEGRRWLQP
jgi:poly(3-hydroxyalkanoate) depolymerase